MITNEGRAMTEGGLSKWVQLPGSKNQMRE